MENNLKPCSQGKYIREIRELLPDAAFKSDRGKMIPLLLYLTLLIPLYLAFRFTDHWPLYLIFSLVIAHCLASLGFLAHELSHNAIIKNSRFRYCLEVVLWGINLIPATLWARVHNHTHHANMNTEKDPDRQFLSSERNLFTRCYTMLFYPNHCCIKWNPLVGFHFIPYILRNVVSCFYRDRKKPRVVPFKPGYSSGQKLRILLELLVIIIIQALIFQACAGQWLSYLMAGPVAYLLASTILMSYIFTNHFLNPVHDISDPLLSTTSVQVPGFFNKIHFNFAYHTEHHIFPSMNSDFYPMLSDILKEKYPGRYNFIRISDAWSMLWRNEPFVERTNKIPEPLQATAGKGQNTVG